LLNTRPIQTPMKTKNQNFSKINKTQIINFLNKKISNKRTYQWMRRFSSNLLWTLTATLLFVVTLIVGPGNSPLIAMT
jgi:hypothetical protein